MEVKHDAEKESKMEILRKAEIHEESNEWSAAERHKKN